MRSMLGVGRSTARVAALFVSMALAAGCGDSAAPLPAIETEESSIRFDREEGSGTSTESSDVTSSGEAITGLEVSITYPSSGATGWLTATLSDETTPATLTFAANPGTWEGPRLPMGRHAATVRISGENARNVAEIPVELDLAGVFGFPTPFLEGPGLMANYLFGHAVTVPIPGVLSSVNYLVMAPPAAGATGRVAVYADAAGSPGALVTSTPHTGVILGRNEIPLAVPLPAGTYWVMLNFSHDTQVGATIANDQTVKLIELPSASALPNPFPEHITESGPSLNVFLKAYAP